MADAVAKVLAQIGQLKRMKKLREERLAVMQADAPPPLNPLASLGTIDLMLRLNPHFRRPDSIGLLIDCAEESWTHPVRITIHCPPQTGKTTALQHFIVATLLRDPTKRIAYLSYNADIAREKGGMVRKLASAAGIVLAEDTNAKGQWNTAEGGGLYCAGIEQGITGRPADIIIVDDPYKAREFAMSAAWQRLIQNFWSDVITTRAIETTSIIVQHTRWTQNDLIGQLKDGRLGASAFDRFRFRHVHIKCESDEGEPLHPLVWSADKIVDLKTDPRLWASLYQGDPHPDGGAVFSGEVVTFATAPGTLAKSIGLDLAYSAKTSADWSVAVVMGREGIGPAARFYILDVLRRQLKAPEFAVELAKLKAQHPLTRTRIYAGGTERGTLDFLALPAPRGVGMSIDVRPALGDKYARATPFAAAWNAGHVYVREGALWAQDFADEIARFTGQSDPHDDQVDAAAAAFDVLAEGRVGFGGGASNDHRDIGDEAALLM